MFVNTSKTTKSTNLNILYLRVEASRTAIPECNFLFMLFLVKGLLFILHIYINITSCKRRNAAIYTYTHDASFTDLRPIVIRSFIQSLPDRATPISVSNDARDKKLFSIIQYKELFHPLSSSLARSRPEFTRFIWFRQISRRLRYQHIHLVALLCKVWPYILFAVVRVHC